MVGDIPITRSLLNYIMNSTYIITNIQKKPDDEKKCIVTMSRF